MAKIAAAFAVVVVACGACAGEEGVKVSSFGWDPADSTRFIQAALDSDAPVIVLDRKDGPWVTLPLWARSNKKIVFEPGVELQAKKGEFRGIRDYLFSVERVENVTIIGSGGARMKMHKSDYQKPPYEHSEWRYALRIVASTNVYVKGLSFVESGGDGILVAGNSKDVTLMDCVCDGNHRQGISVIGAENLLIENCVMKNTSGTPPQAGIDFEPDKPTQPLINCVMRNCLVENNVGVGYQFSLGRLTGETPPLSVRFENCRSIGNSTSARVRANAQGASFPKGSIKFQGCTFEEPRGNGIFLGNTPAGSVAVTFDDCTLSMSPTNTAAPVVFFCDARWDVGPTDDVSLRNFTVKPGCATNWLVRYISEINPAPATNVTGTVRVVRADGSEETITLDAAWRAANMKAHTDRPLPARVLPSGKDWRKAVVQDNCPGQSVDLTSVWKPRTGRSTRYVFYAPGKGRLTFFGRTRPSRQHAGKKDLVRAISIVSVAGTAKIRNYNAPGYDGGEFSVFVPHAGFYEMNIRLRVHDFRLERSPVPIAIDTRQMNATLLADGTEPMSFWIAPGAARIGSDFLMIARGGTDSGSTVGLSLFGADGEKIAEGVAARPWMCLPGKVNAAGFMRLDVKKVPDKPFSFFSFDMAGIPGFFFLSKEKTWRM